MAKLTLTVSTTEHKIVMDATPEQIKKITTYLVHGCDLDITVDADGKPIEAMCYLDLPPIPNQASEHDSNYVALRIITDRGEGEA